jgi:hypothetical protein
MKLSIDKLVLKAKSIMTTTFLQFHSYASILNSAP